MKYWPAKVSWPEWPLSGRIWRFWRENYRWGIRRAFLGENNVLEEPVEKGFSTNHDFSSVCDFCMCKRVRQSVTNRVEISSVCVWNHPHQRRWFKGDPPRWHVVEWPSNDVWKLRPLLILPNFEITAQSVLYNFQYLPLIYLIGFKRYSFVCVSGTFYDTVHVLYIC